MSIFSRWRRGKDFDLSRVAVPRDEPGGDVVVESLAPMVPFLMDDGGTPTVLVRLDDTPESEVAGLAAAVDAGRCVLVAGYKLYSTYPILIFCLFIHDSPTGPPLRLEGYRDIVLADVQDFVVALGRTGGRGTVRLYAGDSPAPVAQGRFAVRIPPFFTPTQFPHRTDPKDLRLLWLMFSVVARQRARIPASELDFHAAADTHMARTENMTSRSVIGPTGTINEPDPDYPYQ